MRGVTLIRVRNGKIAEALGYAKTPRRTPLGQPQSPTKKERRHGRGGVRQWAVPLLANRLYCCNCVREWSGSSSV